MGISRFVGSICFLLAAYYIFTWLNGAWDLGVEKIIDMKGLGAKGYGAFILSIVAGLIGLVIGQGIGGSIKIKNDNLAIHLTVIWHYWANTSIYWMVASMFTANIILGQSSDYFFKNYANEFFIVGLVLSAIGSQFIVWVNFFAGRMMMRGNPLGVPIIKVFPIVVGFMMAFLHFGMFGINPVLGIAAGIILPFLIIPISGNMWKKDMLLRNRYMQF